MPLDQPFNPHARILRSDQYVIEANKFVVSAPKQFKKSKEQEIDESAKRIDELKEEITKLENDIFVKTDKADKDAEEIIFKAESEAERIVNDAEKSAFERVRKSLDDKANVIEQKHLEGDSIIVETKIQAEEIIKTAGIEAGKIKEDAHKEGFGQGLDRGFEESKAELQHMIGRLHSIIGATILERERILVHSEQQIMNLVLTMVKKIVKKLTLEEQDVVVNNIRDALSIIRGSTRVYIHINPSDFDYSMTHKEELIRLIEGKPEVKFFENPTIEKGGVFIETDIGEVDATIATQLEEIENKIKFYIPVKVTTKLTPEPASVDLTASEPAKDTEAELKSAATVDSKAVESRAVVPDLNQGV